MTATVTQLVSIATTATETLSRLAHLSTEEAGAVLLLLLYRESVGHLPGDDHGLSQISRLGANWFRRPAGCDKTRGQRIRAVAELGESAAAAPELSPAQKAQRRAAVKKRWDVVRGGGQMPLPLETDSPPVAVEGLWICSRAEAVDTSPPVVRPDLDEIPEPVAIDFIRGWLAQWTGFKRALPTDDTCRNVLKAAPGRSLCEIYEALNQRFKRKIPPGSGWGWFVVVIRNHFADGGGIYGAPAAVAR